MSKKGWLKKRGSYTPSYSFNSRNYSYSNIYSGRTSNWGYYSSFNFSDDNEQNLFIKSSENYITPTSAEIRPRFTQYLQDETISLVKDLARVAFYKMLQEPDLFKDEYLDTEKLSGRALNQYELRKTLIEKMNEVWLPGSSPMEQAINVVQMLQEKLKTENISACSNTNERVEKLFLDFDRDDYTDPELNEQLDANPLSKLKKFNLMNKMSILGDFGSEFKVEKEVEEKIVQNSDERTHVLMTDHAQVINIDLYQRLLPNYKLKFLTKNLSVNLPVDRTEKKQKIIILLDYSGSMNDAAKQLWVNAILIDRFRYVMKGEAEIFFSYFVHDPDDLYFHHVKNRQDVIDFWSKFSNHPSGGNTDINAMVVKVKEEVEKGTLCNLSVDLSQERPEILVINDGQDRVNTKRFPYKVNAVSLMEFSEELKGLCVDTEGKQIRITRNEDIISYSKYEGEKYIAKGSST